MSCRVLRHQIVKMESHLFNAVYSGSFVSYFLCTLEWRENDVSAPKSGCKSGLHDNLECFLDAIAWKAIARIMLLPLFMGLRDSLSMSGSRYRGKVQSNELHKRYIKAINYAWISLYHHFSYLMNLSWHVHAGILGLKLLTNFDEEPLLSDWGSICYSSLPSCSFPSFFPALLPYWLIFSLTTREAVSLNWGGRDIRLRDFYQTYRDIAIIVFCEKTRLCFLFFAFLRRFIPW